MENKDFCHLHVHDMSSLLDGFGSSKTYVEKAKDMGFTHLAITNHGNVDSLITFQREAEIAGIKPVMGCEAYIVPDMLTKEKGEKRGHINIFVKNEKGWNSLLRLLTEANINGFYYRPRLDFNSVLKEDLSGLIFTTACSASFILLNGGLDFLKQLEEKTDVYYEIMPHIFEDQQRLHNLIKDLNISPERMIATNDAHYPEENDDVIQEILLAIQSHKKWTDPNRWKFSFNGLYLKSADKMIESFIEQNDFSPEVVEIAMKNTMKIANECCDFRIKKQEISLPLPPAFKDKDEHKSLYDLCLEGLKRINKESDKVYIDRLEEEFSLIKKKNFTRYFLIVYELVNWCRENNILTGDRGSTCGCLLAYLIGITNIDPIKHELLFARFINEDRQDYPDIDMDFEDRRREDVRKHLQYIYGEDNISGISTFGSLKGKMALRDVSRVFDIPYADVDVFAKSIEYDGDEESLVRAIQTTAEGQEFARKYKDVADYACRLEGTFRNGGQHAAAIIISSDPIKNGSRANLVKRKGTDVINWAKEDAEYVGLMKLDVLGLNTLSIISETLSLIKNNYNKDIDLHEISIDDPKVYEKFSKGQTAGVFQFNTDGVSKLCKRIKPTKFDHLVDINALYRPGTLRSGIVEEYVKRHTEGEWEEKNEIIKEITKKTYGQIVYQEDVMLIMVKLAGMSWKEADKVRKIIGKSKGSAELAKFKDAFVEGCLKNNTMNEEDSTKLWKDIEEFGAYSFNRSHAVAYSMDAYWCAWLKYYYPTEFICACLTQGKDDKKEELLREAYKCGLKVMPPKVGKSDPFVWLADNNVLYCPFVEVKGIGDKKASTINSSFKNGFYNKDGKTESALGKLLKTIGAYSEEIPEDISDYLGFDINQDPKSKYPNLYKMLGEDLNKYDIDEILKGEIGFKDCVKKERYRNDRIVGCDRCSLRGECNQPILTKTGKYNIFIISEQPTWQEDKKGKPLVGDIAESTVWRELSKYGIKHTLFHTTNLVKCYPKNTKKARPEHITRCSKWLEQELKTLDTKIILAFGNPCISYFTNDVGGIMRKSGTTEWCDKVGAWICWCISPIQEFYNNEGSDLFTKGIENFVSTLKRFPDFDEICF